MYDIFQTFEGADLIACICETAIDNILAGWQWSLIRGRYADVRLALDGAFEPVVVRPDAPPAATQPAGWQRSGSSWRGNGRLYASTTIGIWGRLSA